MSWSFFIRKNQQWARNLRVRVVSNKTWIGWNKGTNGRNKGTHDPIRGKPKRNTTPIRGNTTSDSVSNDWSFVIFKVIHFLSFFVMNYIYNFESIGGQLIAI